MVCTLHPRFYPPGSSRALLADNLSSLTALLQALDDLDDLCTTVEDAYKESLAHDTYEKWDEKS